MYAVPVRRHAPPVGTKPRRDLTISTQTSRLGPLTRDLGLTSGGSRICMDHSRTTAGSLPAEHVSQGMLGEDKGARGNGGRTLP